MSEPYTQEWCMKMAALEAGREIGAGSPDHPLRATPTPPDYAALVATVAKATPGEWFAGCQNDALFIVAGRAPALNNDHPWHDAPRVALAKMFGPSEGDCLPINADKNAAAIVAAVNFCRDRLPALLAERDALREALRGLLDMPGDEEHADVNRQEEIWQARNVAWKAARVVIGEAA